MSRVFVTGATGLIGSVIAEQLRQEGHEVVALVREGTDAGPLEKLGVVIARGDVTDRASIDAGLVGCDGIIHSAAIVGVPTQQIDSSRAVNLGGTINIVDAARAAGVERTVVISTAAVFDRGSTLTEQSPVASDGATDPYTVTKTEAYRAVQERVAAGQHISLVLPGATFGSSPMGERMVNIPGGTQRIARALRLEPASYPPMVAPWSHTGHVARISLAALEKGTSGSLYIAFGAPDCVTTIAGFVNRGCEIAGIDHRVVSVTLEELEDPEVAARFGPTLVSMAKMPKP
ncbi:MAG: NAD-dependent epimerase/dehydratase family protein, partial [Acidimicrobiia bacterium]